MSRPLTNQKSAHLAFFELKEHPSLRVRGMEPAVIVVLGRCSSGLTAQDVF